MGIQFKETQMIHFVVHDENDSVGVVVVEGVKAGQKLSGWIMDQDKDLEITSKSDIPIGHKLAIRSLESGATGIKYGIDIGKTMAPIKVGVHTHVQHLRTKRREGKDMELKNSTFWGYKRENGRVGVRNHVIILPVDDLSNAAAEAVANNIKGTLAIPHPYGRLQFGADLDLHFHTLIGTG